MSATSYFMGDLHFGHEKILAVRTKYGLRTIEEHDEWLIDKINQKVGKRSNLIVVGDVAMSMAGIAKCKAINANKILIPGNHDTRHYSVYEEAGFSVRTGLFRYHEFWVSHAPIHPLHLRGKVNIHAHLHHRILDDPNYVGVSVEQLDGEPISLAEVRQLIIERGKV